MPELKRSQLFVEQMYELTNRGQKIYVVRKLVNTIDWSIGDCVSPANLQALISSNSPVDVIVTGPPDGE